MSNQKEELYQYRSSTGLVVSDHWSLIISTITVVSVVLQFLFCFEIFKPVKLLFSFVSNHGNKAETKEAKKLNWFENLKPNKN